MTRKPISALQHQNFKGLVVIVGYFVNMSRTFGIFNNEMYRKEPSEIYLFLNFYFCLFFHLSLKVSEGMAHFCQNIAYHLPRDYFAVISNKCVSI